MLIMTIRLCLYGSSCSDNVMLQTNQVRSSTYFSLAVVSIQILTSWIHSFWVEFRFEKSAPFD